MLDAESRIFSLGPWPKQLKNAARGGGVFFSGYFGFWEKIEKSGIIA